MPQGISLHIGMNHIDPVVYGPDNDLSGCHNDARAMQAIAVNAGFQTTLMLDEQATAATVIQAVSGAANVLRAGDILFISYSGHGSHVPDRNGDEADGQDETWCLYDRMIIDDELYQLWAQFAAGVRILMLSDSCHSGTVARMIKAQQLADSPATGEQYRALLRRPSRGLRPAMVAGRPPSARELRTRAAVGAPQVQLRDALRFRLLPPSASDRAYRASAGLYDSLQRLAGTKVKETVAASVILISGCQDNQLSADGSVNGLFTEKLLQVWSNGAFSGNYQRFHQQIADGMPMSQTPNYYRTGALDDTFERQKPFTVSVDATNEPVAASLWVRGPETLNRTDPAPTFRVNPGPNSFYIFEITTDASLLDTGVNASRRTDANFWGSWSELPHLSGTDYTLPDAVWQRLRSADRLYYRIGSTATSTGWTNYMVSTPDQQYASAPSITVVGAGASAGTGGAPSMSGPEVVNREDAAPTFTVNTAGAPYFIVEVATNPALFATDANEGARTDNNFYGSWSDAPLLTGTSYTLPAAVWQRLGSSSALYYRIGTTTSEEGWENYTVSVPDDSTDDAPYVIITSARTAAEPVPVAMRA